MEEIFGVILLLGCGFILGIFLAIIVGKIEKNKEDEKLVETVSRNTIDISDLKEKYDKLLEIHNNLNEIIFHDLNIMRNDIAEIYVEVNNKQNHKK
jgi:hypothetical protein